MKSDWKDAPTFAKWLAQDSNGEWYWYENRPSPLSYGWSTTRGINGRISPAFPAKPNEWKETLEERP